MPTNTTQNMTAKKAIAILKGELDRLRSEFGSTKLMEQRLARASGENAEGIAEVGRNVDKALNRVEEAYEYALNACAVARTRKKNAPNEAKQLGVFIGVQLTGTTATAQLPVQTPPLPYALGYGQPTRPAPVAPPAPSESEEHNDANELDGEEDENF